MTTLTIRIDDILKERAQELIKKDWITFTFIINQFLKSYSEWRAKFSLTYSDSYEDLSEKFWKIAAKIDKNTLLSLEDQLSNI